MQQQLFPGMNFNPMFAQQFGNQQRCQQNANYQQFAMQQQQQLGRMSIPGDLTQRNSIGEAPCSQNQSICTQDQQQVQSAGTPTSQSNQMIGQSFAASHRPTQSQGYDPMEKMKNLSNLVHECQALAGNEMPSGTKFLDVDTFTKMYTQLKGDLEKIAKENQRLTKTAETKKVEADEAVSRLKRMEGKTFEWIKLEREFGDVVPRIDAVQRRYGETLARLATINEEHYERAGDYFKKTLAYEERLYLKEKEMQRLAEIDREDIELRFGAGHETTDDEDESVRGDSAARAAALTVISLLNSFYNENESQLKVNEDLFKSFTDLVIGLNDEAFLSKLSVHSEAPKKKQSTAKTTKAEEGNTQLTRLQALLTEINTATLSFEAMFDAFRRSKEENASNVAAFVGFARDLSSTLATNKIAQEVEAERAKEASKALREMTTKADFAENTNAKLTAQHDELVTRMNNFVRETTANHERQIATLRENYERSVGDLVNLNNTVQSSLATTKTERDVFENKSLELTHHLESANAGAEELRSKLSARDSERTQLESKINTLLEHNKGLLERLQHLNKENLILHNTIVSINAVTPSNR